VAREEYPLGRRLYLYTPPNPQNPITREFVSFALSSAGQEIVRENGFVKQTAELPPPEPHPPIPGAPEEYTRLTRDAEQLPLVFRFRSGSSTLDNKALDDLDRAVTFVSGPRYSGQTILLMGFADGQGSSFTNEQLSQDRARVVAAEFRSRGIKATTVTGFGSALPVASNVTAE